MIFVIYQIKSWTIKKPTPGATGLWLEINGRKQKAVATKVGDVWWVHVNGHTMQFEVIEPGASSADDEGGLSAPMPGKILEVHVNAHIIFDFIGWGKL